MKNLFFLLSFIFFFCVADNSRADLIQLNEISGVSIASYEAVDSQVENDKLVKRYKMHITNTSPDTLSNVKATLIHLTVGSTSAQSTLLFGNIESCHTISSPNIFTCIFDASTPENTKIQYTWQIEFKTPNGDTFIDEILVEETF